MAENEETTTLRKINLKLEHENAGLRAALEPFASGTILSHGDGFVMHVREEDVEKARAALGGNHPETPISSGE